MSNGVEFRHTYRRTSTVVPLSAQKSQARIRVNQTKRAAPDGAGGCAVNKRGYLNEYRRSLLAKQRELLAVNSGRLVLTAAGGLPGADYMDQALAESEAIVDAHLNQARSSMRRAVEWALVRIKKGNYGICAACGNPISRARLKAVPWADYCRDCMEQEGA